MVQKCLPKYVTSLAKVCKISEHFVCKFIGDQLDFRQYGGLKGNSPTHYIIECLNFVLSNQKSPESKVILACTVDFSKAFNR